MKIGHSSERLGSNSPTRLLLVRPNCRIAQLCHSVPQLTIVGFRKAREERCPNKVDPHPHWVYGFEKTGNATANKTYCSFCTAFIFLLQCTHRSIDLCWRRVNLCRQMHQSALALCNLLHANLLLCSGTRDNFLQTTHSLASSFSKGLARLDPLVHKCKLGSRSSNSNAFNRGLA